MGRQGSPLSHLGLRTDGATGSRGRPDLPLCIHPVDLPASFFLRNGHITVFSGVPGGLTGYSGVFMDCWDQPFVMDVVLHIECCHWQHCQHRYDEHC